MVFIIYARIGGFDALFFDNSMIIAKPPVKSVKAVKAFFVRMDKFVVTISGFAHAGYQDLDKVRATIASALESRDRNHTVINLGVTTPGIGIAYEWVKEMGFQTTGIVSSKALEFSLPVSKFVDRAFFVADATWGGYLEGTKTLSPTSEAIISVSPIMIGIGGGAKTRDELLEMKVRRKKIHYVEAEMNHARAKSIAKKQHLAEPLTFNGAAHEVFGEKVIAR